MNDAPIIDRDLLITRVIDAQATPEDWAAFRALAAADATVWAELAAMQQDHDDLRRAVDRTVAVADGIEAPIEAHADHAMSRRLASAGKWGGWIAAAALALAWLTASPSGRRAGSIAGIPSGGQEASLLPTSWTPDEALDAYLTAGQQSGRVIGQDPDLVVLDSRKADGGIEVLYVRRIVERAVVDLYRVSEDEAGNAVRIPVTSVPKTRRTY
ncbi:MAG: hypothetical protein H6811_09110 [Phycisphaeraceae bacterium]|nr:hypothetical protein [Phycisphaeraceae bacterium]